MHRTLSEYPIIMQINSYLSFSLLYHIFLFASMFGEIAGVETHQSKSKKGRLAAGVEICGGI